MLKRLLIASLALLPTTLLMAQGVDKYDYAYAMALAQRRGWYDMAKTEFKKLIDSGDEKAAIQGQFGMAKILIFQANREIDPAKKTKLLDDALAQMKQLVASHGDSLVQGRFDLGELQKQKANYLVKRAEKETGKAEELKGEARTAFDEAVAAFKEVAGKLKGATDEDTKFLYRKARYFVIESQYEKALTYKLGDANRIALLKGLQSEIESFGWDHEGTLASYFAYVILGQAHANLVTKKFPKKKDLEDAFQAYDFVLSADVIPLTERVRTNCYWRYIETCNRFKFYDKALALGKRLEKEYPRPERLFFGQASVLELARTHFGKQDYGQAMTLAQKIAQLGGYWGNKAKLQIGAWSDVIDVSSPKTLFFIAEGYYRARNYAEAIRSYQATLEAIAKLKAKGDTAALEEATKGDYELKCWERMAFAYRSLGLSYESYHCLMKASQLALAAGKKNKAAEDAYYAYRTIKRRYYASKAAGDDKIAKQARDYFTQNFQDSPWYPGIKLSEARDLEEGEKYVEAAQAYAAIKSAEFYEEAISRIGICWYKVAKDRLKQSKTVDGPVEEAANKAISGFDAYMEFIKKNKAADAAAKTKREELLGKVVYFRASLHDKLGQDDQVLKTLERFERKFKSGGETLVGAAIWLRLKTYVARAEKALESKDEKAAAADLAKTIAEMELMRQNARGSRYLQFANMRIGFTLDKLAKLHKKGDPKWQQYTEQAAPYLYRWARAYGPIKYDLLKYVAVKLFLLSGETNARYLSQAADLFGRLLAKYPKKAKKDGIAAHVAKCYLLTGRFAESISVLRQEYAANPLSGLAVRGLARAYFEVARKPSSSKARYQTLILNARQEDLAMLKHLKKENVRRYIIQRASVLYEEKERLKKDKPLWNMTQEDYDRFQREMIAQTPKVQQKMFQKLCNSYYGSLLTRMKGLTTGHQVRVAAGVFSYNRSRYYYRIVANKSEKLGESWWDAKYFIIAAYLYEGMLNQDLADRMAGEAGQSAVQKLATSQKLLAKKLYQNLATLYSDFSNPENKKRFNDLYEKMR